MSNRLIVISMYIIYIYSILASQYIVGIRKRFYYTYKYAIIGVLLQPSSESERQKGAPAISS